MSTGRSPSGDMRLDRPTRHAKHRESRRRPVLTQGLPSITQGIADALVVKDLGLYFLCNRNVQVPVGGALGLGLYYRELFAGFGRDAFDVPVRYPVSCHPQAWAAGSVAHLIESLLGLVPEAFDARLRIVRPMLPPFVHDLELLDLRVGKGVTDLRFSHTPNGIRTDILAAEDLDVIVDEGPVP